MKKIVLIAVMFITAYCHSQNGDSLLYVKGCSDAKVFYEGHHCGAGGAVLCTIFTSPVGGAIVAGLCSLKSPSMDNLNLPAREYALNNPMYLRGYKATALKMKRRKLWLSFGITVGSEVIIYSLVKK